MVEAIAKASLIPYLNNRPDITIKEGVLHVQNGMKSSQQADVLDLQEFLEAMERENTKVSVVV